MVSLSGARCVGRGPLFESVHPADHVEAKALCENCPAIEACRAVLLEVQAASRGVMRCGGGPEGTWAGELIGGPKSSTRMGRKPQPREHGTERGYQQHRKRAEIACPGCLEGHRFHVWLRTRYGAA